MKSNISVVLSIHNGEKYLEKCLESVKHFAEEIVIVDHQSTDTTVSIAKKYDVSLYHQKNDPQKIDLQKNFGFSKATKRWILSLDADEELSPELAKEIEEIVKNESEYTAYEIPRKNIIFGQEIKHAGWAPDYQLRLFRNGKGKFVSSHVHEPLQVEGNVGKLSAALIHHNYDSIAQFLHKMIIYAENEADEKIRNGYVFNWKDSIRMPHNELLSRLFAREGYKDGLHGFILSLLQACYHFVIFCFLWEKHKFIPKSQNDVIYELEKEIKVLKKEGNYWISRVISEKIASPGKKLTYKIIQKITSSL